MQLNNYPKIKDAIKISFEYMLYLINKTTFRVNCKHKITKICMNNHEESFFGYYDKNPQQGNYVLFYSTKYNSKHKPTSSEEISVCLYDIEKKHSMKITSSSSYNWQQGCRAHWISDGILIYNTFINNKYQAVLYDVKNNNEIRIYDKPVQDSFSDVYYLSLNYQRLSALRPDYGYSNLQPLSFKELRDVENDGVWHIDLNTAETRLLFSIKDVILINYLTSFDSALHKLNHVMISPDGKKFIFMHRYYIGMEKTDRLFLYDFITGLSLISSYGMVSHYHWIDNDTIIGYMRGKNDDKYYKVNINDKSFTDFDNSLLVKNGDGHPSSEIDCFVTDSYPDKRRIQSLIKCNYKDNTCKLLGEFFHSIRFRNQSRCDLHPRFFQNRIFFDSVFEGKRHLYMMDLDK